MAKPYQEGKVWSIRFQVRKQDIYLTGFTSKTKATEAAEEKRQAILGKGKQSGAGPERTTLAEALQTYALEKLPHLKGAYQEANRINRYLRAAGLDTIKATQLKPDGMVTTGKTRLWHIELVPTDSDRSIPHSLRKHRHTQEQRTAASDQLRAQLARTKVTQVTRHQVQCLITAMLQEQCGEAGNPSDGQHYQPATLQNERALLRAFFNYANRIWAWTVPGGNPASGLVMPVVDNERTRVLTNAEWRRLMVALQDYDNRYVVPLLVLLLATTMRSSEALVRASWLDVDWERCILNLRDAKAGKREVPLSPVAMDVLHQLNQRRAPDATDPRIFPITYEALKKAWDVSCEVAGVEDAHSHDLRRTGTTRYALVYHGNMPVIKKITGHKTDVMAHRYIKLKADDIVRLMHGRSLDVDDAPAGMSVAEVAALFPPSFAHTPPPAPVTRVPPTARPFGGNVVKVDFRRRAA
jgi:integrase